MTKKLTGRGPEFYRYLWHLSLPMILQNLITFSLGLIDTFMVSRLGNTQMAAVTCSSASSSAHRAVWGFSSVSTGAKRI